MKWWLYLIELKVKYQDYITDVNFKSSDTYTYFQISYNKDRVLVWMTYWPLSIIWFLINYPVRQGFKILFDAFEKQYTQISKYILKS